MAERIALEPRVPAPHLLPPQHRLSGLAPPPPGELFVQAHAHLHLATLDENGVLIESGGGPKGRTRRWLPLTAIAAVQFEPRRRLRPGHVRIVLAGLPAGYRPPAPERDPDAFQFIAGREEGEAEELAAHVAARITGPRVVEPSLLPGNQPAHWSGGVQPAIGKIRHSSWDHPPPPPMGSPMTVVPPPPPPVLAARMPAGSGPPTDVPAQLRELARLRAEGLITDADYEAKKRKLLQRW